jgi:hypothetical protein
MPRAPADDQEFLAYCIRIHAEEKRTLEDTLARGASERDISGARLGVYVIALALLTYGRLDVIGDVLENMPRYPHPSNRGVSPTVDRLIPLPADLQAGTSPREVLAWIRANESQLRWDEDAGRFVLETP